ncbi:MAG: zinc ribbon domain-containing protein, partial [Thermoproteota archaeon]
KIECEKCGNDEAVWWMLQTRSADEPTTQFYRCSKCRHTWRNYA